MEVKYLVSVCPHCGNRIRRGVRRFGPAQVECYHCGDTIQTGLTPWADLSQGQKISKALAELLAPSWDFPAKTVLVTLFIGTIVGGSIVILPVVFISMASNYAPPDWLLCCLYCPSILVYIFLFNGIRLLRIISESNKYSQTGAPPIWK